MKRTLLSALTVLAAATAISPIAAAEAASFDIQSTRLEVLDTRTKNGVHKLRLEHLNNQTKAVDNIQQTRLDVLDTRTKNGVHKLRLEHLNNQTKAVDNIQQTRLGVLDTRTKSVGH